VAVTGSPVALTGISVAPVISATLTPSTFNFGTVNRGSNAANSFTLTNTGNVTLTNITSASVSVNSTDFGIPGGFFSLLTTCGTSNPIPALRVTTLAPGATCNVYVQFHPVGTTTGVENGTLSAPAGAAGTMTAKLSGTAR
jgi:hypothetical protein